MFWRYIDFFSLKYNVHVNSIFLKIIDNKKKKEFTKKCLWNNCRI